MATRKGAKEKKMRCVPLLRNARGQFIGRAKGIPAGYTNICLNQDITNRLQWTGVDKKGRKQYGYSDAWKTQRKRKKYARLIHIGRALRKLRSWIQVELSKIESDPIAIMLAIVDHCKMRAGESRYTRSSGSRGVTTLVPSDFHESQSMLRWEAKSGIERTCDITSRALSAKIPDLFNIKIHANTLNNWLSENHNGVTLKDFRTWHANAIFMDSVRKGKGNEESMEIAANKLGHQTSTCQKYYLDPFVIAHAEAHVRNLPKGSLHNKERREHFTESEECLLLLLKKKEA